MAVKIYDNVIKNCGTAISVPKDADAEIGANQISDCVKAIELRDPPSFLESLGLSDDAPVEKIVSVLEFIKSDEPKRDQIESKLTSVGLLDYISGAANISTVVSGFYQLVNSPLLQQALNMLPK